MKLTHAEFRQAREIWFSNKRWREMNAVVVSSRLGVSLTSIRKWKLEYKRKMGLPVRKAPTKNPSLERPRKRDLTRDHIVENAGLLRGWL